MNNFYSIKAVLVATVFVLSLSSIPSAEAQRQRRAAPAGPGVVSKVAWDADGKSVEFTSQRKRYRFDFETSKRVELSADTPKSDTVPSTPGISRRRGSQFGKTGKYIGRPSRGRQYTKVESPDGKWVAEYKDWNLVLNSKDSDTTVKVTTDGDENIHYGTASWVYGEELNQTLSLIHISEPTRPY